MDVRQCSGLPDYMSMSGSSEEETIGIAYWAEVLETLPAP